MPSVGLLFKTMMLHSILLSSDMKYVSINVDGNEINEFKSFSLSWLSETKRIMLPKHMLCEESHHLTI